MKIRVLLFLAVVALCYIASASAKNAKRYPCKTKKSCSKQGGKCIHYRRDHCYSTFKVDSLCKGASCSCCLLGKTSCRSSPKCAFGGGVCVDSKKASEFCVGGTIDKSGCKRRKCVCCTPEEKSCMCGIINTGPRVLGGTEVMPLDKYPWLVGVKSTEYPDLGYVCVGAIINTNYVITSAFCISFWNLTSINAQVGVADFNQSSTDDDIPGATSLMGVKEIFVHKDYDMMTAVNDIALLRLKRPLDLIKYDQIKPVCLPVDDNDDYEGEEGIVAGWGVQDLNSDDFNIIESTPHEATLTIFDPDCNGLGITPNMMCAGADGGETPFIKDVGAPLIVESNGRYVLVGVTIFGPLGDMPPDNMSVYTRVTKYINWILKTIGKKNGSFCAKHQSLNVMNTFLLNDGV